MSTHPLVSQLRFARSELLRCLERVTAQDAIRQMLGHNDRPAVRSGSLL